MVVGREQMPPANTVHACTWGGSKCPLRTLYMGREQMPPANTSVHACTWGGSTCPLRTPVQCTRINHWQLKRSHRGPRSLVWVLKPFPTSLTIVTQHHRPIHRYAGMSNEGRWNWALPRSGCPIQHLLDCSWYARADRTVRLRQTLSLNAVVMWVCVWSPTLLVPSPPNLTALHHFTRTKT
jgi:hypothetical protein